MDTDLTEDTQELIAIDDMPEESVPIAAAGLPRWNEVYALNPQVNFSSALVTLEAKGTALYKCKDWDYAARSCTGTWNFLQSISPGQNYTINLSIDDPGFGDINVTNATHLNATYDFISNIFGFVQNQDGNWSEDIPVDHYVRATFDANLSTGNAINAYVRGTANSYFIVYEGNSTFEVGRSSIFSDEKRVDVMLNNVSVPQDTFDLRIANDENSSAVAQFDWIHDAAACGDISSSDTLTSNISSDGTCINITGSNVLFDCKGYSITYGNVDNTSIGIISIGQNNITVKDCIINNGNNQGKNFRAVQLNSTANVTLANNTITIYGDQGLFGVSLNTASNTTIVNNSITFFANSTESPAPILIATSGITTGLDIVQNDLFMNSSGGAAAFGIATGTVHAAFIDQNNLTLECSGNTLYRGFDLADTVPNVQGIIVTNNEITAKGRISAALRLAPSTVKGSLVRNNTINIRTTATSGIGIELSGAKNSTVSENRIFLDSSASRHTGIQFSGSVIHNITADSNLILFDDDQHIPIFLEAGNDSNFVNTLINFSGTAGDEHWINITTDNLGAVKNISFINTTFQNTVGSVNFDRQFIANSTEDFRLEGKNLNITSNRTFVNITGFPTLNQSAILMFNLSPAALSNPQPVRDMADSGTFEVCASANCTEVSFTNNLFTFNITTWALVYAANETPATGVFPNVSYINTSDGFGSSVFGRRTPVNISANVSDDGSLSWVFASIQVPNGTKVNVTMFNSSLAHNTTQSPNNFSIKFNDTSQTGTYTVIVAANDTSNNMNDTVSTKFDVTSVVSITLTTNAIAFGNIIIGQLNDTADDVPGPFIVQNDGNVAINVTVNASAIFTAGSVNSSSYRFQCGTSAIAPTTEATCTGAAPTTFQNMPLSNITVEADKTKLVHHDLMWQNTNDSLGIDISINVPDDEPGGAKSSTVTVVASETQP